jgi:polar amino acid transport system substrate-binding protein
MKILFKLILLTWLALFLVTASYASETKILIYTGYAPYSFANKDSQPDGLYYFLTKKIFHRAKVAITSSAAQPWARALKSAKSGKGILTGLYKTPDRVEAMDYVEEPYYVEKVILVKRKNNKINYTGLDSIKGKQVGIMRNSSYGNEFDVAAKNGLFKLIPSNTQELSFRMILNNRIEFAPMEISIAKLWMRKLDNKKLLEIIKEPVVNSGPIYMAIGKKANYSKENIRKLTKTIISMKKDGSLELLTNEFLNSFKN